MSNNTRRLRLIATLIHPQKPKVIVGYRFIEEETGKVRNYDRYSVVDKFDYQLIKLSHGGFQKKFNLGIGQDKKHVNMELVDAPLTKLPVVVADTENLVANNVLIVRAKIMQGKDCVGYLVTDYMGRTQPLQPQQLAQYQNQGFFNVKLVTKNGTSFFQAIAGKIPEISIEQVNQGNFAITQDWGNPARATAGTK